MLLVSIAAASKAVLILLCFSMHAINKIEKNKTGVMQNVFQSELYCAFDQIQNVLAPLYSISLTILLQQFFVPCSERTIL